MSDCGITIRATWSRDHGYSRRGIFGGSILQLYRTSYAARSAFLTIATLLVAYFML